MAKVKNYHYYSEDHEKIARLLDEYAFIGRHVRTQGPNHLIVLALPPRKPSKKVVTKNTEEDEDKNPRRGHRPQASKVRE